MKQINTSKQSTTLFIFETMAGICNQYDSVLLASPTSFLLYVGTSPILLVLGEDSRPHTPKTLSSYSSFLSS